MGQAPKSPKTFVVQLVRLDPMSPIFLFFSIFSNNSFSTIIAWISLNGLSIELCILLFVSRRTSMKKSKLVSATAAAFGAAMTTMYAAPELNADIMSLTFSPNTNAPGGLDAILINEIGAAFSQWNDSVGKTMYAGGLGGIATVALSQTLNASTFVGGSAIGSSVFSAAATGTAYVGFSFGGNVGWFSLNLGGAGGTITYLGGEYGSAGESVHVGGTVVPEPTSAGLALLALGALGCRRNRKV
jgi:MYXO-CTERM domain-containing protein